MRLFHLKNILTAGLILISGPLMAFNVTGVGPLNNDSLAGEHLENVSGSSEWCISRVLGEKITCNFKSNSGLFNDTHKVLCSVSVAVAPVIGSEYGEIALGREVFGNTKVWALHAEFPGGNALSSFMNIPFYILKSQVDGLINMATYNALETLKSGVDHITNGPQLIDAIQSEIKSKTCENYKDSFAQSFTEKKVKSSKVLRVSPCRNVPAYNEYSYCGDKEAIDEFIEVKYAINSNNGQILRNKILEESPLQKEQITSQFCGKNYYADSARLFCENEYQTYQFELENTEPSNNRKVQVRKKPQIP